MKRITIFNTLAILVISVFVLLLFLERKRQNDKISLVADVADVSAFLSGHGTPDDVTLGKNGDTYLDFTNGYIYKKQNNTWL